MKEPWREGIFPFQEKCIEFLVSKTSDGGNAGVFDEMGLGKAQPLDAKILTPFGWKLMGEIQVGDLVIGADGNPTKVVGVFPQGEKEIFRVTFNDGATTECCDEHLWVVNTSTRIWRKNECLTMPLSKIRQTLTDISGNRRWCIPVARPINFTNQELPLDPYLLGVLLGDGSIKYGVSFSSADEDLVQFVRATLPEGVNVKFAGHYNYRISFKRHYPNPIWTELKKLDLAGKGSDHKFVPEQYKFASIEQRVALLQGLLDTDGYVSRDGTIQYSSNSKKLLDGVAEVVMSLGGNIRRSQKISASGKNHYIGTLCLPDDIIPFRIARKLKRFSFRQKYRPNRFFASVESAGYKQAQCIKVEAEDHLYITDDYIVTHNTLESIRGADAIQAQKIFIVCPAIARQNWLRELERWQTVSRSIFIVKTSKDVIPEDIDCVIVSYDMLASASFQQTISKFRFDLAIVDEAHMIKNRNAARTKAFYGERMDGSGLVSLMGRVWILTGTPMPNHAGELFTHLRTLAPDRVREEDGRMTYVRFVNKFCVVERKQFGMRIVERVLGNKNVAELKKRIEGFYIRRKKEEVLTDLPPLQWGTVVFVPPPIATKAIKEEEKKSKIDLILESAAASYHNKDEKLAEKVLEFLDTNKKGLASLRRLLGLAKVEPTVEFVKMEMENNRKIILFAYHIDVIAALSQQLQQFGVATVTGATDPKARQVAIDSFQQDPKVNIFIGQITATNSAITLTASDNVLIVEPSWTPSENVQAAARAHRIGQKSSCVLARYVVLAGSLDEVIVKVLLRKSKQISEIMM